MSESRCEDRGATNQDYKALEDEIIALRALLFGCADAMQDADLDATMMSKRTRENFYAAKDLALDHLGEPRHPHYGKEAEMVKLWKTLLGLGERTP